LAYKNHWWKYPVYKALNLLPENTYFVGWALPTLPDICGFYAGFWGGSPSFPIKKQ
jgi:hypothetical protein